MLLLAIACATFLATLGGGFFALSLKDKRHLVLGFSAGAVIAVSFFDLLPEAIELGEGHHAPSYLLTAAALGFLIYLLMDRLLILHSHVEDNSGNPHAPNVHRGVLGAASLSVHSFLDGVAVGLGFSASQAVGIIVAIAVLAHDFSDGINTLNVVLKHGGTRSKAVSWLLMDAIAPVLGIGSTFFYSLPQDRLAVVLAIFAGFFLYIGASDLIPESFHAHPKFLTTVMTLLGAATLYGAVTLAGL